MNLQFRWKLWINRWVSGMIKYYFMEWITPSVIEFFGTMYNRSFEGSTRQKSLRNESNRKQNDYSDPRIIGRHRRPMHHKSRSYFLQKDAKDFWENNASRTQHTSDILMLTGPSGVPDESLAWKFRLIGSNNGYDPTEWTSSLFDDKEWADVALPNHWQLQGFDVPIYTNTMYPFTFDPPFAIREGKWFLTACDEGLQKYAGTTGPLHPNEPRENAVGLYRKEFSIPTHWSEKEDARIFLVFEGVGSSATVYLDGNFIGFSKDSCLPVEFDVTDLLNSTNAQQQHTLAVKVTRWCDGSYLEDQDTWWFSGIYREVYLIRKPRTFISDLEISSSIASNGNGLVSVSVLAEGVVSASDAAVLVTLCDAHGNEVATSLQPFKCSTEAVFARSASANQIYDPLSAEISLSPIVQGAVVEVDLQIVQPILWSAEHPYLYRLFVTLFDEAGTGRELHTETHAVGIRKVEIGGSDNCLLVNNERITIAGVNRSEFDAHHGRAVSKASMRRDALLLKAMNFNAVRSSHYPQNPYWLDVCDEVGLYVIDEANIETHGFQAQGNPIGYLSNKLEWRGALFNRVTRMFERDKNHACIIGWSLGNESGHGATHDLMANWLRVRDPRRFVQVYGPTVKIFCDVLRWLMLILLSISVRIGWSENHGNRYYLPHVQGY